MTEKEFLLIQSGTLKILLELKKKELKNLESMLEVINNEIKKVENNERN